MSDEPFVSGGPAEPPAEYIVDERDGEFRPWSARVAYVQLLGQPPEHSPFAVVEIVPKETT